MCTYYEVPNREQLVLHFADVPGDEWRDKMSPLYRGPFMRAQNKGRELVVGQWGMIPPHSKTHIPTSKEGKRLSTVNARREGMAKSWTYGGPWRKGQRCIIPAQLYVEPYWGTGKHIPWQFSRADGEPWGLAGLWSEWADPATGEVLASYTMITQNCDDTPVLNLMHRLDPKRPPNMQDKRTVVPLEQSDWDIWLHGAADQAETLIRIPLLERLLHRPLDSTIEMQLPNPQQEAT
ncbi:putative SOS response-associated peptidase YedK [Acidovorax sp. 93]|uniref:SOS response-associated peptidase n=1 Tax=Acidovorax sp. 93 TaxID=2135632 RepID=UPI000EB60AF8|nr:SOS response-associated peptidase family protein [Acidovorax sp. 93]RKR26768.1 putative SOS response-associated peptidase YedK [Acidovorax sp. 93]